MPNFDLNSMSAEDLDKMTHIGKDRAHALVSYREQNGGFHNWDDVKKVPGFSDEMINSLKENGASLQEEEE
jgi:competence protein ComEA